MRAEVGAIGGLGREVRFFAEADLVMTRLGGAAFVVAVEVVEVVDVVEVAEVAEAVELGAVFAAGLGAGLELPVCATASSGESKRSAPQESSAAEMEEITNLCARIVY
jgi:hypothetical protein